LNSAVFLQFLTNLDPPFEQTLNKKLADVDAQLKLSSEEKKDAAAKLENNVNLIWNQIRHMENTLSQRLTLAESAQVSSKQA
jgi:hypothetical protein